MHDYDTLLHKRYRTIDETIELFEVYSREYEHDGVRALRDYDANRLECDLLRAERCFAKADAYHIAAFELAHNLERTTA